jgi:hypothetical protein
MDIAERRVIGALILLTGISSLAVGMYTGQLKTLVDMLKTVFTTVIP